LTERRQNRHFSTESYGGKQTKILHDSTQTQAVRKRGKSKGN